MEIVLQKDQMQRLFPFHMLVGERMEILSAGKSLEKIKGPITGRSFADVFECHRPVLQTSSYTGLQSLVGQLVIIRSQSKEGFCLRGQFEFIEQMGLLFIGLPWYANMNEITAAGLSQHDFAPHDPLVDLLHLIQVQEIATRDIETLYEKMALQSGELQLIVKDKELLASLLMQNPDPVLRISMEGTILMQNPAAAALAGSFIYKGVAHAYSEFLRIIAFDVQASGGTLILEASIEEKIFSFSCYMLAEENYINIYGRDITTTKQLELRLEASAKQLGNIINNLQAGVLLENEDRTIALVNQKFCDLFGISMLPDELVDSDASLIDAQFKKLFKTPDSFTARVHELLQRKEVAKADIIGLSDGRILTRDFIPQFRDHQYLGHLWVYNDITAEAKSNEALQLQRTFYEDILNNLPAGVAVLNKNQQYLFLNPRAVQDLQMREWLIGKTDEAYVTRKKLNPAVFIRRKEIFQEVLKQKKPQQFEETTVQPQEKQEHHLRIFLPVLNSKDEIEMIIGYGIDITERKKIEAHLKNALQKTTEEAELKARFFATMSHEIRTSLSGILGIIEILQNSSLREEQKMYTEMIDTSGKQLLRIVNDVLDFEKIINGNIEPESINFDLVVQLHEAAAPFALLAGRKGLDFSVHSKTESLPVMGDVHRIRQILNNLLSNAVKFTQKGCIAVHLDSYMNTDGHHVCSIAVSDTGIGIEQQSLNEIFEPYTQAGSAISRKYGGTGLGLTISRHLALLLGGTLHVQSTAGSGSEFILQLPLPQALPKELEEPLRPEYLTPSARKNLRVLIAEDDAINQFLMQHMLKQWGCTYTLAETGEQVLVALEANAYDIILMDIEMPIMDGIEATKAVRSAGKSWSSIPIIAITANAIKGSREQYLAAGMNGYVTKPYNEQDLQKAIAGVLHSGDSGNSLGTESAPSNPTNYLRYFESMSNDPSFIEKMKNLLKQNIPIHLGQLQQAQQQVNSEEIARILHQMKPIARMLGLHESEKLIIDYEAAIGSRKEMKLTDTHFQHLTEQFSQIAERI